MNPNPLNASLSGSAVSMSGLGSALSMSGSGGGWDDDEEDWIKKTFEDADGPQPKKLHENYTVETKKLFGDNRLMADYFSALGTPNDEDNILALGTIRKHFTPDAVKGAGFAEHPKTKKLISWGDGKFSANPRTSGTWRRDAAAATKIKILYAIARSLKYVEDENGRAKYRITVQNSSLYRKARGLVDVEPFDTETLLKHYRDKKNYLIGGVIWVLGPDKQFYSHVGKVGRIHHSSFFGGNAILCGGDWKVEKGELKEISGQTGHYRTGVEHFVATLLILQNANVLGPDTEIIRVWRRSISYGEPSTLEMVSLTELQRNHSLYQLHPG
jgi:hypothetical protein